MVLAHHITFSTYGFWLPNDPRGSGSRYVGSDALYKHGKATFLADRRRSVARTFHDPEIRRLAKEDLKYSAVEFDGLQARAVGSGFARYVEKAGATVWACAILPDHVHLVVMRHTYKAEQMQNLFKGEATRSLIEEGRHPLAEFRDEDGDVPQCWGEGHWKVFLNTEDEIRGRIRYVEQNPIREGKKRQRWSFVRPFRGVDWDRIRAIASEQNRK